jgi:hypothetical protein
MQTGNRDFAVPALFTLVRSALFAGLTAALAMLPIGPADANDSTASLDAGGLRLTFNPHIRVESEDLYLSRAQVRVVYGFDNTSAHDISTLVAFPLPVMEIGEGGNYGLKGEDPINVMDFHVTADGRQVEPSVEVKATRFGVDVTEILKRHGIPLTMLPGTGNADALNERLNNLPAEARDELDRYGVIDWHTSFGANNKPLANTHWNTHITFYWFQTFPAGRTIEVTHRYRPVPRQFFFSNDDLTSAEKKKAYCVEPPFARGALAQIQQSPQHLLAGYELKYVLTTAGNWMGPIHRFRLTVEKSSPDALVSLCATGIKSASQTSYVLSQENYSPVKDLKVLFVEPWGERN